MSWLSVAILIHHVGLALGLGGAFCVEMLGLGLLTERVRASDVRLVHRLSRVVLLGFLLLCLSGLAFLAFYVMATPTKLANPKLWAKITIILVLGLNGVAVHRLVLPHLHRQIGRPLLAGLKSFERNRLLLVGAVSTVSWLTAALLGSVRELNEVVPYTFLIGGYVTAVLMAFGFAQGAAALAGRRPFGSFDAAPPFAGLAEAPARFIPRSWPRPDRDRR